MSVEKRISRRQLLHKAAALGAGLTFAGPILAACGPTPTPQVIEKVVKETVVVEKEKVVEKPVEKVVEKPVEKVVQQTVVVEKPVTKVVEKEVVKLITPTPRPIVTIRTHDPEGPHSRWWEIRLKELEKEKPYIKIKPEPHAGGFEAFAKQKVMHATKTLGDIIYTRMGHGIFTDFVALDMLRVHDDLIKANGYDLSGFFPIRVEQVRIEGKFYGIPENCHMGGAGLMFNQEALDTAKIEYPTLENWNYDKLREAALKLTKDLDKDGKTDQWGMNFQLDNMEMYDVILRAWGGMALGRDRKTCTINKPEAKEAIQFTYDMMFKDKSLPRPADFGPGENAKRFVAKNLAMFHGGAWTINTLVPLVRDKFRLGAVPLPRQKKRGVAITGDNTSVTALSQHPQEAFECVMWLCDHESGVRKVLENAWSPGARPSVWKDPRLMLFHPAHALWAEVMEKEPDTIVTPWNGRGLELQDVEKNNLDPLWLGKMSVAEAVEKTYVEMQKVLDMPPPKAT